VTTKLAAQTQKTAGIPNGMRTATVVSVSGSVITISVSGGQFSSGVGVITSYAPLAGDTVAVFRQDSSWLILGPTSGVNGWVKFSTLGYQNGWTDRGVGFPMGAYRQTASEVQLIGQITNAAVAASGQVIVAGIPAPPGEVAGLFATQGATTPNLHVDAAGQLRLYNATVAGLLQFSVSYPLDFVIT
jgi:hypothetical protein